LTGSGPPSVQTPIVVNDSRGFYTSRVFGTYTREAMLMLVEGELPMSLDHKRIRAPSSGEHRERARARRRG
jgi:hypothetical protein